MFSKEESAQLRMLFWTSFGKSFPRKWILYHTKIKGLSFKFTADTKKAMVCLDMESADPAKNLLLFDQLMALKNILSQEYLSNIVFDDDYVLESGKHIFRIYVQHSLKFCIHDKNTWRDAFEFYNTTMRQFELFYLEYEDFIKQAII